MTTKAQKRPKTAPGQASDETKGQTIDPDEIARFQAIADEWWDPAGKFRPLHQLAPVRLAFILEHAIARLGLDADAVAPLAGVRLLDIGCGGGLIAEPMARLGADVTAIDAGERNIAVARLHAETVGLEIDYRQAAPEQLVASDESFDLVLNLEVVEHVADVELFLGAAAALVRPGGGMVLSTINRTMKSLMLAKVMAEYVLRWLPVGTHDWRKFVRPSELSKGLAKTGMRTTALAGMSYDPIGDNWRLGKDLSVNYLAFAEKT